MTRPASHRPATGRPATGRPATGRPATRRPAPQWPAPLRAAAGLAAASLVAGCSVFGAPAAEEPAWTLVQSDGAVEIRDYAAFAVAQTTVADPSRDSAVSEGFSRLFDYITGANTGDAEIAMTAPVFVDDNAGREIAMTAPVIVDGAAAEDGWRVVFVLPEGMTEGDAPRPTDARVSIATVPARRVAAIRFTGFFSAANIEAARTTLADWLAAEGIAHRGDWQSAGYNPPWTLPWLKRNEVIVTLAPPAG